MRFVYQAKSASPAGTVALAKKLARQLLAGDCVLLKGEMGVGKTCFAGGIAWGLGIHSQLISPTFNICREYQGRLPLQHFDLYRLQGDIWDETGLDEAWAMGIRLVEWAPPVLEEDKDMMLLKIELVDKKHRTFRLYSPRELRLPQPWQQTTETGTLS